MAAARRRARSFLRLRAAAQVAAAHQPRAQRIHQGAQRHVQRSRSGLGASPLCDCVSGHARADAGAAAVQVAYTRSIARTLYSELWAASEHARPDCILAFASPLPAAAASVALDVAEARGVPVALIENDLGYISGPLFSTIEVRLPRAGRRPAMLVVVLIRVCVSQYPWSWSGLQTLFNARLELLALSHQVSSCAGLVAGHAACPSFAELPLASLWFNPCVFVCILQTRVEQNAFRAERGLSSYLFSGVLGPWLVKRLPVFVAWPLLDADAVGARSLLNSCRVGRHRSCRWHAFILFRVCHRGGRCAAACAPRQLAGQLRADGAVAAAPAAARAGVAARAILGQGDSLIPSPAAHGCVWFSQGPAPVLFAMSEPMLGGGDAVRALLRMLLASPIESLDDDAAAAKHQRVRVVAALSGDDDDNASSSDSAAAGGAAAGGAKANAAFAAAAQVLRELAAAEADGRLLIVRGGLHDCLSSLHSMRVR